MSYEVTLNEQAALPTLVVRTRTSVHNLPSALGQAYGAVASYLGGLGQAPAGPPFSAYYNADMEDLDVEIGFPVAQALPGEGEVQAGRMQGGTVAMCLHMGPYSKIGPAYEALTAWMAENRYEAAGPAYEIYLNDPGDTPHSQLRTQVVFPVRPAS